jgi:hypothetical protein
MSFALEKITEEEYDTIFNWPKGNFEVDFKITKVDLNSVSQAGNKQIVLDLLIKVPLGRSGNTKDFFTGALNMRWKIKHLGEAIGNDGLYLQDTIAEKDLLNKEGKAMCKCESFITKDGSSGERAKIVNYLKVKDSDINDDIGF